MAVTVDVIRRLTVQGETVGMDKVTADLKAVAAGQEQVAETSAKLVAATSTTERSLLGVSRQLDSYTRSMDPLARAQAQVERGERLMSAARAQGITVTDAQTRAMANAAARVDELKRATEGHTVAAGLNRGAQMQLRAATTAFFDQVQAGDFYEALASDKGGLSGGIKTVGGSLLRLATGWQGVAVGITATIGAGAIAANAYVDGQRKMAAALTGTGRAAGLTLAQLNDVAAAGSKTGNISIGSGRELAGTFAHAGIGGDVSQSLIGSAPSFSRATGVDLAEGGKTLAVAFADPEKGALELNKSLGFLNDRILTAIHVQEASGNIEGARRTMLEAYNASLKDVTEHTWTLSTAFDGLKASAGNGFGILGKSFAAMLGNGDPSDRLRSLQTQQGLLPTNDTFNRTRLQGQIDALQRTIGTQSAQDRAKADAAKTKADADALSMQAREIIRGLLPELDRNESFQTRSGVLGRTIGNPAGLNNPADATRALGMLTAQHAFSDPMLVMQQDAKLALDSVNAVSLAQRAGIEARRAELAVLRETGDAAKAAAAAQNAMNVEMARTRKEAEDRLESSRQELAMVGKTPFQRGLMEIDNQFKGKGGIFEKDAATSSQLSAALAPVQADLRAAGDTLAQALRDIADKVKAPFLSVDGKPVPSPYGTLPVTRSGPGALSRAPATIFPMISDAADKTGIDARIIAAIGEKENSFRLTGGTTMLGSNGRPSTAFGFGQLTNGAAADVAAAVPGFSKYNPSTAVFGSAAYLSILQRRKGGDMTAALNAYGGTPGYAADIYRRAGAGGLGPTAAAVPATSADATAALSADKGAYANKRQAYIGDQFGAPLKSANEALDQQIKLLDVQHSTMGKSAAEIQAAAKAQELWNTYTAMDPNREAGVDVWKKLGDGVDSYRTKMQGVIERTAAVNAQNQRLIDNMDGVRDASKGALSTFVQDLRNGAGAGKALQDVMSGLTDKLLDKAENSLVDGLFGKSGTPGTGGTGGMMGGLLHGIFPSVFHQGGIVGGDAPMRMVPASAFAGAPRYHSGMGLSHDERPAILQTGEAVISRADLSAARAQKGQAQTAEAAGPAGGSDGGAAPQVTVHNYGGQQVEVTHGRGPDMQRMIEIHVGKALQNQAQTNGPGFQAFAKRMGTGRTGA